MSVFFYIFFNPFTHCLNYANYLAVLQCLRGVYIVCLKQQSTIFFYSSKMNSDSIVRWFINDGVGSGLELYRWLYIFSTFRTT